MCKEKLVEKLYKKLEEILEEDVKELDILEEFEEWDSLSIITLISFIDKEYKVNLYTSDIKSVKTAGDLVKLIESKKG